MPDEKMDTEKVISKLNDALAHQLRSALHYTLLAGSITGFNYQAFADQLWQNAASELEDARRLIEKVRALGGDPTTTQKRLEYIADPVKATQHLIDCENEAVEALKDVIQYTGQEGASEALEHLMEHAILRKQSQIDFLTRAIDGS